MPADKRSTITVFLSFQWMNMTKLKESPRKLPPFSLEGKYPTNFERALYQLKNAVYNRLYPVHPIAFSCLVIAILAYQLRSDSLRWFTFPVHHSNAMVLDGMQKIFISLIAAYTLVYVIRFILKRTYFSYKGFLFEDKRNPSFKTKLWAICHKLLSYTSPTLCTNDSLLPNLPVPKLSDTIARYLESVEGILSKEEFDEISQMTKEFERNEGRKLQILAQLYSYFTDNYVTGFWEKYAYHYSRESLLINSSVAHCDLFTECIPANQAVRAAHVSYIETLSMLSIDKEQFRMIGDGLLCGCHYKKMYATTRVPGKTIDHLDNHRISRHMVAFYKGNFYRVEMFDENNRIYSIPQLSKIYADILTRQDQCSRAEAHVAALTTDKRERWSMNRDRFFLENKNNRKLLKVIDHAIAFIVLDECEDYGYDPAKPERLDKFLRNMLTGDGKNRWADKSVNYCISANGRCGGTTEHSIADGMEFDHLLENFVYMDTNFINEEYPAVVKEVKSPFEDPNEVVNFKRAKRLNFEVTDEMEAEIERCYNEYQLKISDVDIAATIFRTFGKGIIKKGQISPDGFVQMAIQLANFKDQKKFSLTYESASARFYANSRTETLRTVSKDSCAFVNAMMDPNCTNDERYRLLQVACEQHVQRNRECMLGRGVDRHLFVLYILSKAISVTSPFLDYYISQPWLLSTSQAPKLTGQTDEDLLPEDSWLGAAFGPVARNGYGICYRFAGNHSICIHISSLKSASNTDSHRFQKHLTNAFVEIASLFTELK